MATRSQVFRSEQERSGTNRKKASTKQASNGAGRKKASTDNDAPVKLEKLRKLSRNASLRADTKTGFALEESATGKPSRKSTRGGGNHLKPDSNLKRRETRKINSPESRAARASAAGTKTRGKSTGVSRSR
jgi:hypothetical protein